LGVTGSSPVAPTFLKSLADCELHTFRWSGRNRGVSAQPANGEVPSTMIGSVGERTQLAPLVVSKPARTSHPSSERRRILHPPDHAVQRPGHQLQPHEG